MMYAALLAFYSGILLTEVIGGNYPKALYWFGAIIVTAAVWWME